MTDRQKIQVKPQHFKSAMDKLNTLLSTLEPAEKAALSSLINVPSYHGSASQLVFGGADGVLVLSGPNGITVLGPGDPLPTDFGNITHGTFLR